MMLEYFLLVVGGVYMKGVLILSDSSFDSDEGMFSVNPSVHGFELCVYVDDNYTLEKQLSNVALFDNCMDRTNSLCDFGNRLCDDDFFLAYQNVNVFVRQNFSNIWNYIEYVVLSFENYDSLDYIRCNPMLLSKKIVLKECLKITDYDKLIFLLEKYSSVKDIIYVSLEGNSDFVSLDVCYRTINYIKNCSDSIKNLNLSPMETIMYVYDLVRSRVYSYEGIDDSYFKSRDLSMVLFGDKIVCLGFANIFSSILNFIGIDCRVVFLSDKNNDGVGHARNVIYVQDDKYEIDGVYYFDPTWDCKKVDDVNNYLCNYRYFAKTRTYMDNDARYDFFDEKFPFFSLDMYDKIECIVKSGNTLNLFSYLKSLNYMSNLVVKSSIVDVGNFYASNGYVDAEIFLDNFNFLFSKFNKPLTAQTMLLLLNNVRRVEFGQNSELYPYSVFDLYKTFKASDWVFYFEPELGLLELMYSKKVDQDEIFFDFVEQDLFKIIEQERLFRVLSLVYDKKKNSKYF